MKRQHTLYACTALFVLSLVAGTFSWRSASAEITEPTRRDSYIAMTVSALMKREHVSRRPIDEEIAARTMSNMLKTLDPQKIYFYQSDVDEFTKQQENLGNWFRSGDIKISYVIFKTFLARVDERVAMIQKQLEEPVDFTIDEEMVTDRDSLTYPKTPEEARERVRKRVKYELLLIQANEIKEAKKAEKKAEEAANEPAKEGADANAPAKEEAEAKPEKTPEEKHAEALQKLSRRYSSFAKRMHQMDSDDLLEMYVTAMTTSFDPHSSYMSPNTQENFDIAMRLELDGIGASLTSEDGYVVVKRLVPGGAAEKEGSLKVDDKITGVAQGEDGEFEDVVDMKLDDVVKKIRGKRGTIVRLEVLNSDSTKKIVKIVRSKIELTDSEAKGELFEYGKKLDGTPYKIGVIDLPSFYMDMEGARANRDDYKSTTRDVRRIIEGFKEKGVDAIVIDLRTNGGGSLQESITLTGLFIDSGTVVQVKDPYGKVSPYQDTEKGALWTGPLVVMINKLSASASEIFAGAIQDYRRGLIVGDKTTHGKGTVQTLIDLSNVLLRSPSKMKLGSLKVTIQQFYRPLGDSTQNHGVKSDVELPALTTHMDIGEADLDYALPFDQVPAQPIRSSNKVNPALVQALQTASTARVAVVEDFQTLQKKIDYYCKQKDRKSVTLNLEKFLADQADVLEDEAEKLEAEEMSGANDIKRDFYLDEVLNITTDYMQKLK